MYTFSFETENYVCRMSNGHCQLLPDSVRGQESDFMHFFHRTFEFSGLSHAWINQLFARKRIREKKFDHLLSPVTQHYAKANLKRSYYSMNAPIGVTLIGVWCKFRIHEWSHILCEKAKFRTIKSNISQIDLSRFANCLVWLPFRFLFLFPFVCRSHSVLHNFCVSIFHKLNHKICWIICFIKRRKKIIFPHGKSKHAAEQW